MAERQVLKGGIVLIVHPANEEQLDTAAKILRRHFGEGLVSPLSV
jgi:hypothetical protein